MTWCCCGGAKLAIITPIPPGFPNVLPCGHHQCPICQQQAQDPGQPSVLQPPEVGTPFRDNFTFPSQPMPWGDHLQVTEDTVENFQSMETQTDDIPAHHIPVSVTDVQFQSLGSRPRTLDSQGISGQQFYSLPSGPETSVSRGTSGQQSRSHVHHIPVSVTDAQFQSLGSRPRTLDSQGISGQQFYSLPSRPKTSFSRGNSGQQFRSLANRPVDPQGISSQQFQSSSRSATPSEIPAYFTRLAQWGSPDRVQELYSEAFSLPTNLSVQAQHGSPQVAARRPQRQPLQDLVPRSRGNTPSSGVGGLFRPPSSLLHPQPQQPAFQIYEDSRSRPSAGTTSSGYRSRSPRGRVAFIGNENLNQGHLNPNMPVSVNYNSMMRQIGSTPVQQVSSQRQLPRSNAVYVPSGGQSPRPGPHRPVVTYEGEGDGDEIVLEEICDEVVEHLAGGGVKKTVSTVSSTYTPAEDGG